MDYLVHKLSVTELNMWNEAMTVSSLKKKQVGNPEKLSSQGYRTGWPKQSGEEVRTQFSTKGTPPSKSTDVGLAYS